MIKKFSIFFVVLFCIFKCNQALKCYHCFSIGDKATFSTKGSEYVECNYDDLPESNTWECPNKDSVCTYQKVETKQGRQVWRSCSNGFTDPCDPSFLPPNTKMLDCKTCNTDKCNLMAEQNNSTFTFNVNANVNLYIKQ